MLMMTPDYANLREQRARETIDWLVGNFDVQPIPGPVIARLNLGQRAQPRQRQARAAR